MLAKTQHIIPEIFASCLQHIGLPEGFRNLGLKLSRTGGKTIKIKCLWMVVKTIGAYEVIW